jgi:hypothetical protein
MSCTDFQRVLPYIIDTGGSAEEQAHLRECAVCSDLVADLKYIAEQAKLLVPLVEPSSRVWEGISRSIRSEGLARPQHERRGRVLAFPQWARPAWAAAAAAIVLVVLGIAVYRNNSRNTVDIAQVQPPAVNDEVVASGITPEDQTLLAEVATAAPDVRETYENGFKQVNAYIAQARGELERNPNDQEARAYLMEAYEQKSMLYEMAMSHAMR